MTELRQLVLDYVEGRKTLTQFRRDFVIRFLTVANPDAAIERAANRIESECADFSLKLISETELKARLTKAVEETGAANLVFALVYFDVSMPDPGQLAGSFAPSGTNFPSLSPTGFSSSRDPLPNDLVPARL